MLNNSLSRLSDQNVSDPIIRNAMYKELLTSNKDNWVSRAVSVDEEYRPDIVSYRVYGTAECSWLVLLVAGLSDELDSLPVGQELRYPPAHEVRQKIKQFSG